VAKLSLLDYLAWAGLVALLMGIWVLVGIVGSWIVNQYIPIAPSPVSSIVFSQFNIVYYSGGFVFSLFTGTLIFFAIKFRERGGESGGSS